MSNIILHSLFVYDRDYVMDIIRGPPTLLATVLPLS